jgi:predicted phosphodiesterase
VRYLILSDIHSNLEALAAVAELAQGRYDRALCCGDLVGYGADPNEVVDWVRENCAVVVRGNHDRACTGSDDLGWFNPTARAAAMWTRQALTPENRAWLIGLPRGPLPVGEFELAHGSISDEDEYLAAAGAAAAAFAYLDGRLAFFGHTHMQGGFAWRRQRLEIVPRVPARCERTMLDIETDTAYLINPGSVGQPRDGDPRAAFAIFDSGAQIVTFWRAPYDFETTRSKILEAGLPPMLGNRLATGK